MAYSNAEERFVKAVRSSGLVPVGELERALALQAQAERQGRQLPLDRILLKFGLLDREQILGLWRAIRYYVWRKEDKFYAKLAVQSKLLTPAAAKTCLREQKRAYKHEDLLVRVNEIARQRGYLKAKEDAAVVAAMHRIRPVTLRPVEEEAAGRPYELPSKGAARLGKEQEWLDQARREDLDSLRKEHEQSVLESASQPLSDEDLDPLWSAADLDDVELDSQAIEVARAPLLESDEEDTGEDDLDLDLA